METNILYSVKDEIESLCHVVGDYQMSKLGNKDLVIQSKSSTVDFVTEVDKRSEEMIIHYIQSKFPDHSILAEESGETKKSSDYMWIIDPVDGTTNYAHGYPLFAISIGLQHKSQMLLGCIYLPALKEFYWAIKGEGAFMNNKPIKVSQNATLESSIVSTGFPYNKKTTQHNNLDYFAQIMPQVSGIRRSGSACVDLVSVAIGRIDGYFEMYLNPWDFLPGQLLVTEAGGLVSARYVRERYSIVAANPLLHPVLREEIEVIGQDDY